MTDQLEGLLTEQVDDRYDDLDTASVARLADLMNQADAGVPDAVRAELPRIVPNVGGHSEASSTPSRPAVPEPT
jgi:N-acetylmuramic acid 6-phosphate etherase